MGKSPTPATDDLVALRGTAVERFRCSHGAGRESEFVAFGQSNPTGQSLVVARPRTKSVGARLQARHVERVRVAGKRLAHEATNGCVQGVTYGPFAQTPMGFLSQIPQVRRGFRGDAGCCGELDSHVPPSGPVALTAG